VRRDLSSPLNAVWGRGQDEGAVQDMAMRVEREFLAMPALKPACSRRSALAGRPLSVTASPRHRSPAFGGREEGLPPLAALPLP
jgi:hypothetical protein